jgi:hypothetical protein
VFQLLFTSEARAVMADLESGRRHAEKLRKVRACLAKLSADPQHPGLHTHRYHSKRGPEGADVWEVYVENRTPSAWRVWFCYGPGRDTITVITIAPHP